MRPSKYLYGSHYDKHFVQQHIRLFHRQAIWAEETAKELMQEPIFMKQKYYDFETKDFISVPVRDMRRVNACLNAAKWNRKKIREVNAI